MCVWAVNTLHELDRPRRLSRSTRVLQEAMLGDSVAGMITETVLTPCLRRTLRVKLWLGMLPSDWVGSPSLSRYAKSWGTRIQTQNCSVHTSVTCSFNRVTCSFSGELFANPWPFTWTGWHHLEMAIFQSWVNPKAIQTEMLIKHRPFSGPRDLVLILPG